ncbi:MAG: hypothetical protein J6Q55_03440 [Clostridia bacterium]|nr:hypothetical protein [Clostridia bacterium]
MQHKLFASMLFNSAVFAFGTVCGGTNKCISQGVKYLVRGVLPCLHPSGKQDFSRLSLASGGLQPNSNLLTFLCAFRFVLPKRQKHHGGIQNEKEIRLE